MQTVQEILKMPELIFPYQCTEDGKNYSIEKFKLICSCGSEQNSLRGTITQAFGCLDFRTYGICYKCNTKSSYRFRYYFKDGRFVNYDGGNWNQIARSNIFTKIIDFFIVFVLKINKLFGAKK